MIDELDLARCPLNSDSRLYLLSSFPKAVLSKRPGDPDFLLLAVCPILR